MSVQYTQISRKARLPAGNPSDVSTGTENVSPTQNEGF